MKPCFNAGDKFITNINGTESVTEVEYVSSLPLGTGYTIEYRYLCKVFNFNNGRHYFYRLVQERDLSTYQKI